MQFACKDVYYMEFPSGPPWFTDLVAYILFPYFSRNEISTIFYLVVPFEDRKVLDITISVGFSCSTSLLLAETA